MEIREGQELPQRASGDSSAPVTADRPTCELARCPWNNPEPSFPLANGVRHWHEGEVVVIPVRGQH